MNIFILDEDPVQSARYHVDRHLVSQTKESLQLLGTAYRLTTEGAPDWVYKVTHASHPCGVWTRESLANWRWLRQFAFLLLLEWRYRSNGRVWDLWLSMLHHHPEPSIPDVGITDFAQAMPEELRVEHNPVAGYRRYYNEKKQHLFDWKRRAPPPWIRESSLSAGQRMQRQMRTPRLEIFDVRDDTLWPDDLRSHLNR